MNFENMIDLLDFI